MKRILIILLFIGYPLALHAINTEYAVKGVLIEKFTQYIEWPDPWNNPAEPFVLVILGKDPFNGKLDHRYHTHKIQDRHVKVVYIDNLQKLPKCHILFIPNDMIYMLETVVQKVNNLPVLTIGENDGAALRGLIINFYYTKNKTIHFEININAAKKTGIIIDSGLLEIAKVIKKEIQ